MPSRITVPIPDLAANLTHAVISAAGLPVHASCPTVPSAPARCTIGVCGGNPQPRSRASSRPLRASRRSIASPASISDSVMSPGQDSRQLLHLRQVLCRARSREPGKPSGGRPALSASSRDPASSAGRRSIAMPNAMRVTPGCRALRRASAIPPGQPPCLTGPSPSLTGPSPNSATPAVCAASR
jgi:hypothetical protein